MFACAFQLLSVSAIVLANLCVSYIMTSQNEEVRPAMFILTANYVGVESCVRKEKLE